MPRAVGVDIGDDVVRAVVLKKRGQQFIAAGVGVSEIPLTDDWREAGQALAEALKGAGAKKRDPVVCSIGGPQVIIRLVKLPAIPLQRIVEAIRWQFRETGLLPEGDLVFDAQVLQTTPGGELNILAVCAPRGLLDKKLKLVETAGIVPLHIDVEPLATLNAFLSLQSVALDETIVLVSLSEPLPFLCLYNRQSQFPLIRYFSEGLENPASIVEEIRTSVTYFQAELAAPGTSLRCLYCGNQERFAGLKDQMASLLNLWNLREQAAAFDPLAILEWERSILPAGKLIQGTELAQAVGLALRAL
ncbi:MAG: pilus assembly protein PilM [Deltaproteobacteria bacterium]|nr:pilus assembly protein PilM [Deltaproteobacteria bacterium]